MPKSITFTVPPGVILMLAGLRSRCDDPAVVRGLERARDLARDPQRLAKRQGATRQAISECCAFDQFEDQSPKPSGLFDLVNRADVRMIERGEQTGLTREAGEPIGIASHMRGQNLDRDVPAEFWIARTVDLAHAARAEQLADDVRPERGSWHKMSSRQPWQRLAERARLLV